MKRGLITLVLLWAMLPATAARHCDGFDLAAWSADTSRDALQCLGDLKTRLSIDGCTLTTCKGVAQWRKLPDTELVTSAAATIKTVRDDVAAMVAEDFDKAAPVRQQIDAFLLQLKQLSVDQLSDPHAGPLPTGAASRWDYDENNATVLAGQPGELRLGDLLDQECAASPDRCNHALLRSARVVVDVWLVQVAANSFLAEKRAAFVQHVGMLDQRWQTYFNGARFQYPWELALNSYLYRSDPAHAGLMGPPNSMWILAHPAVGMRYRSGAERRLDDVLILEVIGYQKWQWSGSDMTHMQGGSLIAVWTHDTTTTNRPALGAMVHLRDNWSVGITMDTRTDMPRRASLLLSADLGKLFQNPQALRTKLLGTN